MTNQYQSRPGYFGNVLSYSPNGGLLNMLVDMLKGSVVPNAQVYAPPGMSQADFNMIRMNTQRRSLVEQSYNTTNPNALYLASSMMNSMGINNPMSYFIGPNGNVNGAGRMVSDMFNRVTGSYSLPFANMGTNLNTIIDSMQGLGIDRASFGRSSMGIGQNQAHQIYTNLMRGTYSDSALMTRRGPFDSAQMMDIFRMASDRDMFRNVGVRGVARRTQGLARTIDLARTTFGMTDNTQALNAAMEMTGGDIALSSGGELQETLRKVKDLAKSANMSIDILRQVVARGAEVSKQLGMSGGVGANLTTQAITSLNIVKSIGGGTLSDRMIAEAGGIRSLEQSLADTSQQFLASDNMRQVSGVLGAFNKLGISTAPIMNRLNSGEAFTPLQFEQSFNKLVEAQKTRIRKAYPGAPETQITQMARVAAERSMRQGVSEGQRMISEQAPGAVLNQATNQILRTMRLEDVPIVNGQRVTGMMEETEKKIRAGQKISDEEMDIFRSTFMDTAQSHFAQLGKSPKDARALAAAQFDRLVFAKEYEARDKAQKKRNAKDRIKEDFLKRTVQRSTFFERGLQALGIRGNTTGDLLSALLPESVDEFGLRSTGSPDDIFDMTVNARDLISTFGTTAGGMDVYRGLSNIMGSGLTSSKQARSLMKAISGDLSTDVTLSSQERAAFMSRTAGSRETGAIISLKEVLGNQPITKGNVQKALAFLKDVSPDSFKRASAAISNFNTAGLGESDLVKVRLDGKDSPEKQKALKKLADAAGLDEFDLEKVKEIAKTNPEVARQLNFLNLSPEEEKAMVDKKVKEVTDQGLALVKKTRQERVDFTKELVGRVTFSPEGMFGDVKGDAKVGMNYLSKYLKVDVGSDKFKKKLTELVRTRGIVGAAAELAKRASDVSGGEGAIGSVDELGNIKSAIEKTLGDDIPERLKLPTRMFEAAMFKDPKQAAAVKEKLQLSLLGEGGLSLTQKMEVISDESLKGLKGAKLAKAARNILKTKYGKDFVDNISDEGIQQFLHESQKDVQKDIAERGGMVDKLSGVIKEITNVNPLIKDALEQIQSMFGKVIQGNYMSVKVT